MQHQMTIDGKGGGGGGGGGGVGVGKKEHIFSLAKHHLWEYLVLNEEHFIQSHVFRDVSERNQIIKCKKISIL